MHKKFSPLLLALIFLLTPSSNLWAVKEMIALQGYKNDQRDGDPVLIKQHKMITHILAHSKTISEMIEDQASSFIKERADKRKLAFTYSYFSDKKNAMGSIHKKDLPSTTKTYFAFKKSYEESDEEKVINVIDFPELSHKQLELALSALEISENASLDTSSIESHLSSLSGEELEALITVANYLENPELLEKSIEAISDSYSIFSNSTFSKKKRADIRRKIINLPRDLRNSVKEDLQKNHLSLFGNEAVISFDSHTWAYRKIHVTFDEKMLVLDTMHDGEGDDHFINIIDLSTGTRRHILPGHQTQIHAFVSGKNSKFLFSADLSGVINMWDIEKGTLITTFVGSKFQNTCTDFLLLTPNEKYLLAIREDTIEVWDIEQKLCIQTLVNKSSPDLRNSVFALKDNSHIITIDWEGNIKKWDFKTSISTSINEKIFDSAKDYNITAAFMTSDEKKLILTGKTFINTPKGSTAYCLDIWDLETNKLLKTAKGSYSFFVTSDNHKFCDYSAVNLALDNLKSIKALSRMIEGKHCIFERNGEIELINIKNFTHKKNIKCDLFHTITPQKKLIFNRGKQLVMQTLSEPSLSLDETFERIDAFLENENKR